MKGIPSGVGPTTAPDGQTPKPAATDTPTLNEAPVKPLWVTLGQIDSTGTKFPLLVTLTNRGAAIERIELSKYFDIDDNTGYLGQFSPEDADGGCLLQVVGAGTPAERAGLRSGDILTGINGFAVKSTADLRAQLSRSKPGHTWKLEAKRAGATVTGEAKLARYPLSVIRPEPNYLNNRLVGPPSLLLTMHQIDDRVLAAGKTELEGVSLLNGYWAVWDDAKNAPLELTPAATPRTDVTFRAKLPTTGIEVFKRYRLVPKASGDYPYDIAFSIEIRNAGDAPRKVAYRLDGPNGLPTEGWWYVSKSTGEGLRDLVDGWNNPDGTQRSHGITGGAHTGDPDSR